MQSLWSRGKLRLEAENLKRAQHHEHIVRFFGQVRHGPYQVFVLEAWGQSDLLEHVLEHRGLGVARSVHILPQLLSALEWLHSQRICHGDVKPENLLCDWRDGVDHVKLADFGSASLLPPEGFAAVDPVAQGTTLYSSPEVLLGKRFSCAADMWATGITTCALAQPHPPCRRTPRVPAPAQNTREELDGTQAGLSSLVWFARRYVLISGNFPFGNTSDALSSRASFEGEVWSLSTPWPMKFISALLRHDPSKRATASESLEHAWFRPADLCVCTPTAAGSACRELITPREHAGRVTPTGAPARTPAALTPTKRQPPWQQSASTAASTPMGSELSGGARGTDRSEEREGKQTEGGCVWELETASDTPSTCTSGRASTIDASLITSDDERPRKRGCHARREDGAEAAAGESTSNAGGRCRTGAAMCGRGVRAAGEVPGRRREVTPPPQQQLAVGLEPHAREGYAAAGWCVASPSCSWLQPPLPANAAWAMLPAVKPLHILNQPALEWQR